MNETPLRCFVGWDSREPVAFQVLVHSILTRASGPVAIIPLVQSALREAGCYTRARGATESTEFSLTRFLCPFLAGFQGIAVFLDSDILCRCDLVGEVHSAVLQARSQAQWRHQPKPALWCVHHDYTPTEGSKFLGNVQTVYPRKNFSSVMIFDAAECRALTPEFVNHATGLQLHRFQWLEDDRLAALPVEMNHLVSEYQPNPSAKLIHWTLGGPWVSEYREAEFAEEWFAERDAMLHAAQGAAVAA